MNDKEVIWLYDKLLIINCKCKLVKHRVNGVDSDNLTLFYTDEDELDIVVVISSEAIVSCMIQTEISNFIKNKNNFNKVTVVGGENLENTASMFRWLKTNVLDIREITFSKTKNMHYMFAYSSILKMMHNIRNNVVEDMTGMFLSASIQGYSLDPNNTEFALDLRNLDTSNCKSYRDMFCDSDTFKTLIIPNFHVAQDADLYSMFQVYRSITVVTSDPLIIDAINNITLSVNKNIVSLDEYEK